MTKQIEKTDWIKARLVRAYGGEVNTEDFAVFESVALNTRPLLRRTGVWARAEWSPATLHEMAAFLESDSVPLQVMHNDDVLPVGKVFHGAVVPNGAETDLHALFYVPKGEQEILAKIESGIVDEVSVGLKPKTAKCSECGWDFFSDEATIMHWLEGTCENDHTMGVNGAHVKADGLDNWSELSLVGKGAAVRPKILSRSKSSFSEQQMERIAASGMDSQVLYFFGSATPAPKTSKQEKNEMDEKALQAALDSITDVKADLKVAEQKVEELTATIAERDAAIKELTEKLEAAEKATGDDVKSVQDELATVTASLTEASEFIKDLAEKSMVQLGQEDPKVPESIGDQIKTITEAQAKLRALIPAGGLANSAEGGNVNKPDEGKARRLSAFKTSK